MDAPALEPAKAYSTDIDADPELGDVEPMPTQAGMEISFKDLTYTVPNSAKRGDVLALLRDVSGFFMPGEMSALMGPSGSGKTTLLDVLAGRKTAGSITGTIGFAGRQPTRTFLRRYAGYVEQFDTLIPNMTVYEMLMYTAELKNSRSMPLADKRQKVDAALRALALETCRDVRIGDPLNRGISGAHLALSGQAKRTNIGLALVTSPRVLFLDEPTSGLDSFTANEVMAEVKALVRGGVTICATIHSPTPYAFSLFDSLMILLRGRVVYFGDRGGAAVQYFKQTLPEDGAKSGNPHSENEAEWIVNLTTRADRAGKADEFAALYDASSLRRENDDRLDQVTRTRSKLSLELQRELDVQTATTTPSWFGFLTLHKYRSARDFRDPRFIGPRTADKLLVSVIMMTLYWKQGKQTDAGSVNNVTALLFMWVVMPAFTAVAYVPVIILERPLFLRERNDGLYRVITYLSFKISEEVAMQVINSVIFSLLVFYTVKLQGQFAVFWLVYLITSCVGIIVAYFIAALAPTMEIANTAVPAYVVTLLYFVGLLIRKQDVHNYWKWYMWLDPLHYAWTALVLNQYDGTDVTYNGQLVAEFFDIYGVSKWGQVGFESLFFAGFFGLAWLALSFRRYGSR